MCSILILILSGSCSPFKLQSPQKNISAHQIVAQCISWIGRPKDPDPPGKPGGPHGPHGPGPGLIPWKESEK